MFENLYSYTEYKGEGSTYTTCITEHFKFFITELFVWTNVLLFKYKKFNIARELFHTKYFVKSKFREEPKFFGNFRFHLQVIEYRSKRLDLRRLSIIADKLVERSYYNGKDYKGLLVDVDLILYYVSKTKSNDMYLWYPVTYIYKEEYSRIEYISKMVRKKYFDEFKVVFNIDDAESMKTLITEKLSQRDNGFPGAFGSIPTIQSYINAEEIATL